MKTRGFAANEYGEGSYVSAADAPYSQRSLPPNSLETPSGSNAIPNNYHVYTVIKPFLVEGGPIAPWFGQPGLGAQFDTNVTGKIDFLLLHKYLKPVDLSTIQPGPKKEGNCVG